MVRQFKDGMQENLPAEAFDAVPPQLLSQITNNPNALLSPEASESMSKAFAASGESGVVLGEQVFTVIRESLAGAIGDVFFLAFIFVAIAVIATAFIREVPLRKRGGPPGVPVELEAVPEPEQADYLPLCNGAPPGSPVARSSSARREKSTAS